MDPNYRRRWDEFHRDFESPIFGPAPLWGRESHGFNRLGQGLRNQVWNQANRNWNRTGLPGPVEARVLQESGLPIGPAIKWLPERMPVNTTKAWWTGGGFGQFVKPAEFPSRWQGIHPTTGGAMRSGLIRGDRDFAHANATRIAPKMRTQQVRWFGGPPMYPSNWSPERVSFEQAIRNPLPSRMR